MHLDYHRRNHELLLNRRGTLYNSTKWILPLILIYWLDSSASRTSSQSNSSCYNLWIKYYHWYFRWRWLVLEDQTFWLNTTLFSLGVKFGSDFIIKLKQSFLEISIDSFGMLVILFFSIIVPSIKSGLQSSNQQLKHFIGSFKLFHQKKSVWSIIRDKMFFFL